MILIKAIGRCDRIGQTKNVHLHYIIAQDTVRNEREDGLIYEY